MVGAALGFVRDVVKGTYLGLLQIVTRLFYVDREFPSSVRLGARLDVVPRCSNHKRHRLVLKKRSSIEERCVVNTWHGDVVFENGAGIGIGTIVIGPVTIGQNAICSQNSFISGESHLYADIDKKLFDQGFEIQPVFIEEDVWMGANCVVLPGVRIGKGSVVGAGSVVTKDIPSYSVAVGNPARVIKQYDSATSQWVRL
jgi:acetyltransferase-like isoleucine patch superfamily enzyme